MKDMDWDKKYIQGIDITDGNMEDSGLTPVLFDRDIKNKEERGC